MKSARRTSRFLAALAAPVVALSAGVAHAVPPEYFHSIALHPTDPQVFAVRYESAFGGLFLSRNGGQSFQLVPARAFYNYGLQRRVPMTFAGDGTLLLALDSGLLVDDGKGCMPPPPASAPHASEAAVAGLWVMDVTPHPTDPDTSFVLTSGDTMGAHSGVWRRNKQGLVALGKSEPAPAMPGKLPFIASDLAVIARTASMDGVRFIEAGTKYDHSTTPLTTSPVLRVSDDLGTTWTTYNIPDPNKTSGNARILLVDGSEPFKAIVSLENGFGEESSDPMDPLFVTKDGGQSFTPYLDKIQVAEDAVLLPSGQILIGDRGGAGGLWSADNFDATPTKIRDSSVNCLAYQPKTQKLLMCSHYEVGYYDVANKSFCAMFRMNEVAAFPSCPSAPLDQNAKGIDQLCNGLCGAAHFASAPVCTSFPIPPNRTCGPSAVAYDNSNPDPNKRWVEPPGDNAAPRCAGFVGRPDGGVAPVADAGVGQADAAIDAGVGVVQEAGTPAAPDAAIANPPAQMEDDAGSPSKKKKSSGCQLASGATGFEGAALFATVAFMVGLARRRQVRLVPRRQG
jgi:hypothetical protein